MNTGTVILVASEEELVQAWLERRYAPGRLVDSLGRPFSVVFAGRRWGGPGPDLKGAVLALADGSLLRGDVEVHRRLSDWWRHGHDRDAAYGRVILHVVQAADGAATTLDVFGRAIPHVVLEPELASQRPPVIPQSPCRHDPDALLQVVEAAGLERFRARAARFEGDAAALGADDALWQGLAEALGFTHNARPMRRLAELVPWAEARLVCRGAGGSAALAARLLATAGLVGRGAGEGVDPGGAARSLFGAGAWERTATHPANDPARRIRGLAILAERYARAGEGEGEGGSLSDGLLGVVRGEKAKAILDGVSARPLVGRGRALVVAANVLLPFAAARGLAVAERLYGSMPPEPANRAAAYMAAQLFGPRWRATSLCQQQGLIGLFKGTCELRVCERCPAWSGAGLIQVREAVSAYA